ncbi:MAG: NAD(P)/FAD-dependent oxidoreductase, partial [Cellvibrionales bacterium]
MTEEQDKALGMDRAISRRDFVQGAAVAVALGASGPGRGEVTPEAPAGVPDLEGPYYPPTRTGMRGSHPGSFETAHALARSGAGFEPPEPSNETYDLVVVGGGISGLAAAHYYRSRFGETARILILDNHDDFGGHAKRNEFHQGGRPVLSLGGTHNLEWWAFSDTVNDLLAELGIDIQAMRGQMTFRYGLSAPNSPAFWFDKDTYGAERLLTGFSLTARLTAEQIEQIPISSEGRDSLYRFYSREPMNVTAQADLDAEELVVTTSYPDFLRQYGGLTDDAVQLFDKAAHGAWGVEMRALSVRQALEEGFPGGHLLGMGWSEDAWDYPVAMWPDGNASLARLLVARLMPDVASGV